MSLFRALVVIGARSGGLLLSSSGLLGRSEHYGFFRDNGNSGLLSHIFRALLGHVFRLYVSQLYWVVTDPMEVFEGLPWRFDMLGLVFLAPILLHAASIHSASAIASLSSWYSVVHVSFQMYGFNALVLRSICSSSLCSVCPGEYAETLH